jgi:hypothetical protein
MKRCVRKRGVVGSTTVILGLLLLVWGGFPVAAGEAPPPDSPEMTCYRELARTMVHGAALGLGGLLKGVRSEKERIARIRAFIAPIRFFPDASGYFYVYTFDCVNVAHATQQDLPGRDLSNHRDVKGKYVIRELSAAARSGGGFVDFYWLKPGARGEQKKLGYVEPIPGTNYFIGSGVYLRP